MPAGLAVGLLSLGVMSGSALAAPAASSATVGFGADDGKGAGLRDVALAGALSVESRVVDDASGPLRLMVSFDEPLAALRRVEGVGCSASLVGLDGGTVEVELSAFEIGSVVGVRLIDAVAGSDGSITPWSEVVLWYRPADMNGDNVFDLLDIGLFAPGFLKQDAFSDMNGDGVFDLADVSAFVSAFQSAVPSLPAVPRFGPARTLMVPAGGQSRAVTVPLRVPGGEGLPGDAVVTASSGNGALVEDGGIEVAFDGEAVTVSAMGAAGAAGSTNVTVTAASDAGETVVVLPVVVAPDGPPVARFSIDNYLGEAPLVSVFDASLTSDPLRNIASYSWDFGDGSAGSGVRVSHVYGAPGEYTATLTVTDDSGFVDTHARVVTVAEAGFDHAAVAIDRMEARRFLWQAAFGPTEADIGFVMANGFEAWIDGQIAMPATAFDFAAIQQARDDGIVSGTALHRFYDDLAVLAPDQLRQRAAWALIQVIVMNADQNGNDNGADALYYNRYIEEGLGNYGELLEWVTLSYQMGVYLTYNNSSRADPATGRVPDENYAREVMQLFSLGLTSLDPEGRPVLDAFGEEIPTYDLEDVVQFARSFTGLRRTDGNQRLPMSVDLDDRELGDKQLLDYPGVFLAGGYVPANFGASEADVIAEVGLTVGNVFEHPSCPPFIAELLIKRFVTSNPTRGYVGRVAEAFRGDGPYGNGVRGDLAATVKAILLDAEARDPAYRSNPAYGRVMEPIVTSYGLLRATGIVDNPDNPPYIDQIQTGTFGDPENLSQGFMRSPSVFNFYRPDFTVPETPLERGGLSSPEMQIHTSVTAFTAPNTWLGTAFSEGGSSSYMDPLAEAANFEAGPILDALLDDFAHGPISDETRAIIEAAVEQVNSNRNGVRAAVRLLIASPEFTVIK